MSRQCVNGLGLFVFRSILVGLFLILVNIAQIQGQDEETRKVFACYWASWSHYREGDGRFSVDDIDPNLCTHIIYSFATINNRTYMMESLDPSLEHGPDDNPPGVEDMYRRTVALKSKNTGLKVLIGVGGWNLGAKVFSDMAASSVNRKLFIDSAVQIVRTFEFDGIDLDWEYPYEDDKENFVKLVRELRIALNTSIPTPRVLLTAALGAGTRLINGSYDFPNITEHLDFMSIMAYDYKMYTSESPQIEHHSPLYYGDEESVETSIQHILEAGDGIEKFEDKIILGVGAYGRTYTLKSRDNHTIGSSIAEGLGGKYPISQEAGIIYYFEMCLNLIGKDWDFEYEDNLKIPYTFNDTQWIGYDDEYSIAEKVDFAFRNNLRGMMIWSLDMDDFRGRCGSWWNSPLANAVKNRMQYNLNRADQN